MTASLGGYSSLSTCKCWTIGERLREIPNVAYNAAAYDSHRVPWIAYISDVVTNESNALKVFNELRRVRFDLLTQSVCYIEHLCVIALSEAWHRASDSSELITSEHVDGLRYETCETRGL